MSNGFHPGQGGPLAPPGFERKDPRPDSPDYVARHPTLYGWREDIEELIRLIYRQFGGPDQQQMNTYVNHPPEGPPDSDPEHVRHMHLTLLSMQDQLVLRPHYTISKGVERLRRM
jgi:hypothetical protein